MRRVAVLTSGRQDFGILRSTLRRLERDPRFELALLATGMHLEAAHGDTLVEVRREFPRVRAVEMRGDGPAARAGALVAALASTLAELAPEGLVVVGDRSETAAAALAATIARVPLIHLHGGEETEGAIDNVLRHAITKMSHLHLVAHPLAAARVRQMGEADASVHVVGAPGLDNLFRDDLPARAELEASLGAALPSPLVVVTYHPTTLGGDARAEIEELIAAMRGRPARYVITLPNDDDGAAVIRDALRAHAQSSGALAVDALGERRYFGLLGIADAVLGNSSSGIIEAPALQLPTVNVGDRQAGRLRGANVIDVPCDRDAIAAALARALDPEFRRRLAGSVSPYGDGRSAERIVELLAGWQAPPDRRKRFVTRSAP